MIYGIFLHLRSIRPFLNILPGLALKPNHSLPRFQPPLSRKEAAEFQGIRRK
jgi:hypothetical protein